MTEQSGIHAGDGGFQIKVGRNTGLKGGVITSSDQAVADGLNRFTDSTIERALPSSPSGAVQYSDKGS